MKWYLAALITFLIGVGGIAAIAFSKALESTPYYSVC
jgi:hypothetical protein